MRKRNIVILYFPNKEIKFKLIKKNNGKLHSAQSQNNNLILKSSYYKITILSINKVKTLACACMYILCVCLHYRLFNIQTLDDVK